MPEASAYCRTIDTFARPSEQANGLVMVFMRDDFRVVKHQVIFASRHAASRVLIFKSHLKMTSSSKAGASTQRVVHGQCSVGTAQSAFFRTRRRAVIKRSRGPFFPSRFSSKTLYLSHGSPHSARPPTLAKPNRQRDACETFSWSTAFSLCGRIEAGG